MNNNYKRLIQLCLDLGHEHFQKMIQCQRVGNFEKAEEHRTWMLQYVEDARAYSKMMSTEDSND